jgi:hypothetical protein
VGWKRSFRADEVPFPTALTFLGNTGPGGGHISDPERRAAVALTSRLRDMGIRVSGTPAPRGRRTASCPLPRSTRPC